jgi:hypothetical protein
MIMIMMMIKFLNIGTLNSKHVYDTGHNESHSRQKKSHFLQFMLPFYDKQHIKTIFSV